MAVLSGQSRAQVSPHQIAQAQLLEDSRLMVELSGFRNLDGEVCVSLFDSSEGFPNEEGDAVVAKQCIDAVSMMPPADVSVTDVVVPITFSDLVAGRSYAVSVWHDENGDGELNEGTFGIPTEGFGFSRNPEIGTSAPEFYESALLVLGEMTTSIEMIYF